MTAGWPSSGPNLFHDLPVSVPDELFTPLMTAGTLRIERIVSTGHASPPGFWYDQDRDEWVVVLRGRAVLEFEGKSEPVTLDAGDHVHIPARCRHRVAWTDPDQPTVWLAVHYAGEPPAGGA